MLSCEWELHHKTRCERPSVPLQKESQHVFECWMEKISHSSYCHDIKSHQVLTGNETVGWLEVDTPTKSGVTYEYLCKGKIEGCKYTNITYEKCKQECESKGDKCVGIQMNPTAKNDTAIISDWEISVRQVTTFTYCHLRECDHIETRDGLRQGQVGDEAQGAEKEFGRGL